MKSINLDNRFKNILLVILIIGGYTVFFAISLGIPQHTYCLFKNITGIPCPGCGMGRGTLELFTGNIKEAFILHPLVIPFHFFVFISLMFLLRDIVNNSRYVIFFLKKKPPLAISIMIAGCIAILWTWNISRGI